MITSLKDFLDACRVRSSDEIYDLFEHEISDSVYDEIMSHCEDVETSEPVRQALNSLGLKYSIRSLIDY